MEKFSSSRMLHQVDCRVKDKYSPEWQAKLCSSKDEKSRLAQSMEWMGRVRCVSSAGRYGRVAMEERHSRQMLELLGTLGQEETSHSNVNFECERAPHGRRAVPLLDKLARFVGWA